MPYINPADAYLGRAQAIGLHMKQVLRRYIFSPDTQKRWRFLMILQVLTPIGFAADILTDVAIMLSLIFLLNRGRTGFSKYVEGPYAIIHCADAAALEQRTCSIPSFSTPCKLVY